MLASPRRSWFSSRNFPRLRSHPIHLPSLSFQTRLLCSSRKRLLPSGVGPCTLLSRSIPSTAMASSSSSVGRALARSVQPVGQKGEMKFALGIREVVDLELLDQLFYDVLVCQQGRHNHKGSQWLCHAVA